MPTGEVAIGIETGAGTAAGTIEIATGTPGETTARAADRTVTTGGRTITDSRRLAVSGAVTVY